MFPFWFEFTWSALTEFSVLSTVAVWALSVVSGAGR